MRKIGNLGKLGYEKRPFTPKNFPQNYYTAKYFFYSTKLYIYTLIDKKKQLII